MKLGAGPIFASLLVLGGSFGCIRYVERTACAANCSGSTRCGLREVERYSMRWPVAGAVAAAVLLGTGGLLVHEGRSEIDDLQNDINSTIITQGTRPFDWDPSREDKALLLQNVGSGLIGAGLITLVTAAVLYFYQKKTVPVSVLPVEPLQTSKDRFPGLFIPNP